jgi:hypothetical protein
MKITDVGAAYDPQFERVDTPRTDALMGDMSAGWHLRWADSHVQLKRELAEAVAAERERCAKVCERVSIPYENTSSEAAAEIRKGE